MGNSMKKFNTRGVCIPEKHYMVDISAKVRQIIVELIDTESYFTINRPRQYGKTTMLYMLKRSLNKIYNVLPLSFEDMDSSICSSYESFSQEFLKLITNKLEQQNTEEGIINIIKAQLAEIKNMRDLSDIITQIVKESSRPTVLFIDEVDKSSNNQLFLDFLGMLRNKYLLKNQGEDQTFYSVILAGVHDIKSIKTKIKAATTDTTVASVDGSLNSPWNIAADFLIEMSFNSKEIATMLEDFSKDRNVAMDIPQIAEKIYFYTSGYPFLVSRICEIIDARFEKTDKWELADIDKAVKLMLQENSTNFDSLIKNLENNLALYNLVKAIIIDGENASFNIQNPLINYGILYGIFKKQDGMLKIHNRIYEQLIYNYMSSKIETSSLSLNNYNFAGNFIINNELNMERVLLKFQQFMKEQYSSRDEKFWERHGKLILLAFIKPIINGKGFDFKEVQISEEQRLDVVITFMDKKYVLELKIWRGQESHESGLLQLGKYLESQGLKQGYLVIFNFNKKPIGWTEERRVVADKEIFVVVV
jgi:hypothetical protein